MMGEPFKVEHLCAARRHAAEQFGFRRAGIAVEDDEPFQQRRALVRRGVEKGDDGPAEGLVAALEGLGAPSDLTQDRGKCAGPHAAAPAIDEGPVASRLVEQVGLDIGTGPLRDQRAADLARAKRALLLVDRPHEGPLGVIEDRQVEGARNMIVGKLAGRAHIQNVVESRRKEVAKMGQGVGHAPA